MRISINHPGLTLLAGAGVIMALIAASPAQAAQHKTVASQVQHFNECLTLLISDPARHAQECGPGHAWTAAADVGGGGGPPPRVTTTTTSQPEDPCEQPPCEPPPCEKPPPCHRPPPCEDGEPTE